jgi:hypothetical protein
MGDPQPVVGWLIPLPSDGTGVGVDMKAEHMLRVEKDGLYEITYQAVVERAEQIADISVYVSRNAQPIAQDCALRQTVGLLAWDSTPVPVVFAGHLLEMLNEGDLLRLEHDAGCAIYLARGRSASLFIRKIDI